MYASRIQLKVVMLHKKKNRPVGEEWSITLRGPEKMKLCQETLESGYIYAMTKQACNEDTV